MQYKHTNQKDHRMLVVVLSSLAILFFSTIQQWQQGDLRNDDIPNMGLTQSDSGLLWVAADDASTTTQTTKIRTELTPFFFEPVRVNSASKDLLMTLPGIGPGLADTIIRHRNEHGPMSNGEEFMQIQGFGLKRFADLQKHISFD